MTTQQEFRIVLANRYQMFEDEGMVNGKWKQLKETFTKTFAVLGFGKNHPNKRLSEETSQKIGEKHKTKLKQEQATPGGTCRKEQRERKECWERQTGSQH